MSRPVVEISYGKICLAWETGVSQIPLVVIHTNVDYYDYVSAHVEAETSLQCIIYYLLDNNEHIKCRGVFLIR